MKKSSLWVSLCWLVAVVVRLEYFSTPYSSSEVVSSEFDVLNPLLNRLICYNTENFDPLHFKEKKMFTKEQVWLSIFMPITTTTTSTPIFNMPEGFPNHHVNRHSNCS